MSDLTYRRELARRAAICKVLGDQLKAAQEEIKAELLGLIDAGETVAATMPGCDPLAKVSRPQPRSGGKVVDTAALLAWAREHAPSEVERTIRPDDATMSWLAEMHPEWVHEQIRPAYAATLCAQAKSDGVAHDEQGEIIPGIEQTTATEYVAVKLAPDAATLLADAWRGGGLAELPGMLAAPLAIDTADDAVVDAEIVEDGAS